MSAARLPATSDNRAVTILIVDDVSDTRGMYASYFAYVGAGILAAQDGEEALEAIDRHRPDAVLLDLSLPKLTGWDVLKALRSKPDTAQLPVVAITGYVTPGIQKALLVAGADLYLSKPCLPHVAFNFIIQLVRARRT